MDDTKKRRRQRGFTLIELMAVIVIIGILASIATVAIVGRVTEARITATKVQIRNFEGALKGFKIRHGFYPSSDQGLEALVAAPTSGRIPKDYPRNGYLDSSKVPDDQWGNPYIYESPGSHGYDYEIVSFGADGLPGGEDENADIESWNIE